MKTIIKYNPALWAKATIFAGVFFFAYGGVFQLFFNTWTSRDDYSHGFLIPLISIYLVWVNREKLKKMQVSPSIGLGSVLMALLVTVARNRGIGQVHMICTRDNSRMQRLAEKFGARLHNDNGDILGKIEPEAMTSLSILDEVMHNTTDFVTAVFDWRTGLAV